MSFCAIALMRWRSRSMTFWALPAMGFLLWGLRDEISGRSARAIWQHEQFGSTSDLACREPKLSRLDHAAKIGPGPGGPPLGIAAAPSCAVHLLAGDVRTGSAQAGSFYAPTDNLRIL